MDSEHIEIMNKIFIFVCLDIIYKIVVVLGGLFSFLVPRDEAVTLINMRDKVSYQKLATHLQHIRVKMTNKYHYIAVNR